MKRICDTLNEYYINAQNALRQKLRLRAGMATIELVAIVGLSVVLVLIVFNLLKPSIESSTGNISGALDFSSGLEPIG